MPKRKEGRDYATGKPINLSSPEEAVRQEYEQVLVEGYGYLKKDLDIEVRIPRGSGYFDDRADIVIYQSTKARDPARDIIGIVETKRPNRKEGLEQLKSYMTATSAEWAVWTNGDDIAYLYREKNKVLDDYLNNIPVRGQSVNDVGRITKQDLRPFVRGELRSAFRRILNTLYSNTSISRREKLGNEMIKLIFSKLEDEKTYHTRPPEFRAEAGESPAKIAKRIRRLFEQVREELKHDGIFRSQDKIELDNKSIAWVVGQLERGSLLMTDSDVVGDAFEVFSESKFIGEKGEFFTPRGVVRVAVKLANPKPGDKVCDPACGSGGFLLHAMKHVWNLMEKDPKWKDSPQLNNERRNLAARSFFGIDKETDLVKIAKAHMAIAGDGRSNIVHENSLHQAIEFEGEAKIHFINQGQFEKFDIVLTNPPFGTKNKVLKSDAKHFYLGHKWAKDKVKGTGKGNPSNLIKTNQPQNRDPYILFIERVLDLTKSGGVVSIVLPESVFHAPSLSYVRQYFMDGNNVRSIIDLPHNTFRPNCNAKTCLLTLEKGVHQQKQIVMATPEEMGHDHNGNTLYRYGTEEVWDDLETVLEEIDEPENQDNKFVFTVSYSTFNPEILVPRFYRHVLAINITPSGCYPVSLGRLVEEEVIEHWDGHGSPPAQEKGRGNIPYFRTSDVVNWELYRNPVTGIPQHVYDRHVGDKQKHKEYKEQDVIFVRRGSYRIGTVAMVSPRDTEFMMCRELLCFRVKDENKYGITPFYLLTLLSSKTVQRQMENLVFVDTTLPNIGDRWKHLILPVHTDMNKIQDISSKTEESIRFKWSAQETIDSMRSELNGIVT